MKTEKNEIEPTKRKFAVVYFNLVRLGIRHMMKACLHEGVCVCGCVCMWYVWEVSCNNQLKCYIGWNIISHRTTTVQQYYIDRTELKPESTIFYPNFQNTAVDSFQIKAWYAFLDIFVYFSVKFEHRIWISETILWFKTQEITNEKWAQPWDSVTNQSNHYENKCSKST